MSSIHPSIEINSAVSAVYRFGGCTLALPSHVLKRGDEVLNLPCRQRETLALIVCAGGRPVAKQAFLDSVWKGAYVEEANLTQTVFLLRRALGKLPGGGEYIETLPRFGYRLAVEVVRQEVEVPAAPGPRPRRRSKTWALALAASLLLALLLVAAFRAAGRGGKPPEIAVRYDPARDQPPAGYRGLSANTVSFSPDGRWLAYVRAPEGSLWRGRAEGTDKRRLSAPGEVARSPQWSPDGRTIAYVSAEVGRLWGVHLIASAGGAARAVLPDGSSQGAPSFAPDGRRLVFERGSCLAVVDLRTGAAEALPGSEDLRMPKWSPDGGSIAALAGDREAVMLYDLGRRAWTVLAERAAEDLAWDGNRLLFLSLAGGEPGVYRVDPATHAVALYGGVRELEKLGLGGWRLALDGSRGPLLLREAGLVEVYRVPVP